MEHKSTPGMSPEMSPEELEKVLWFFRTEDASTWNYSILGLAAVGLVLGLFILGRNVMANRKRKNAVQYSPASLDMQSSEMTTKQAFVALTQDDTGPPKPDLGVGKGQEMGEILVQWKGGNITSLYREAAEEDV